MKYLVTGVMIIILTAACSVPLEAPVGEGRVTVSFGAQAGSRTLVPDLSFDMVLYRVTFLHENGSEVSMESSETMVEAALPVLGNWSIRVEGYNADELLVAIGTVEVYLESDQDLTVSVTLTEADGEGVARFEMQWNPVQIRSADVEGSLIDIHGQSTPMSFSVDASGEAVGELLVEEGFYTLEARLLDGSTVVAGIAEAVQIATGGTTSYLFSFDSVNKPGEPISVTGESFTVAWDAPVDPDTGVPVAVEGYSFYYREHGSYQWIHLADTAGDSTEYTVTTAALSYGEYDFAVASVSAGTESELHTSYDDTADPTYGWYVVWN